MLPRIGLLGGTFDPIHLGHLRLALELKQTFGFQEMRLLPCHQPPHRRSPLVGSAERAQLVRLALAQCPDLLLDERELRRDRPSYTIDTLQELRAELGPEVSLCWALGSDAFAGLHTWHRWQELLDYAHLVVIARPEAPLPQSGPVAELFAARRAEPAQLANAPQGSIVQANLRLLPISATEIRDQIARGESPQFLLPDCVWHHIDQHHWYRSPRVVP
jgi:nicotinate-nucleotide adenylyltransferase